MKIINCRVNHLSNPLGFHMDKTVFSWTVEETRGKTQTAARIQVWSWGETIADTGWDELDSLATSVPMALKPRTRYYWNVSVRTDAGEEETSESCFFETACMEGGWNAKWIGCDDINFRHPIFSKEICPEKEVLYARLYICGLGLYEARWNGEKIGDEYLTPYCNNYDNWVQYQTFDITRQLRTAGTLSVELGNGWYKGRFGFDRNQKPYYGDSWKLMAQVYITYVDGAEAVIGTDESWMVTRSHIFFSNIYDGEQRDDTLPDTEAVPAFLVEDPKGTLTARYSVPVKAWEKRKVKQLIHTPAGETVLDVGQNMTGIFRLAVHEPAGTRIHLQFGEILQDGNFYRDNLRTARAEYVYISDGEAHVLEPKFTFYGFRYVKVEGIPGLKPLDFTALVLYSQLPRTGMLETGNALVNQLISNIEWSQKGNFLDVPTDCPQRDERMGWTGDAQVFAPAACYQRDSYSFFRKYLHDVASEQADNGGIVPDVVPSFGKRSCSAAWGDAACVIPMTLYEIYGDPSILEVQYPSMKSWVESIRNIDGETCGWRHRFHYGDWLALDTVNGGSKGGTEEDYVADIQYRHSVLLLVRAARILGKTEDADEYEGLANTLHRRIREEFFTPTGRCAVPTQTGYLLALQDGNAPDEERILEALVKKLAENGGRLQTGFVGTPLLCQTLTRHGREEEAFELLLYEGYPGWLYAVKQGATTIWERWDSVDDMGKITENGMNSLNHYAYGAIACWLYADVAGIAPAAPGFRKARLVPNLNAELKCLRASFRSAAGVWKTEWEVHADGDVSYRCTVPFGCTAELTLPYGGGEYTLSAGEFACTYTPDKALVTVYNINMPLGELMAIPKVKEALHKMMPQITQLPPSMAGLSMSVLAAKMGVPAAIMEKVDTMLANL